MWEESLGTQAGVHLIEGVRLIRGPLNTGFTVFCFRFAAKRLERKIQVHKVSISFSASQNQATN